jgi:hypothetical protein
LRFKIKAYFEIPDVSVSFQSSKKFRKKTGEMIDQIKITTIILIIVWQLIPSGLTAQITVEQAYPVDSLIAHTYLTSVVLHSENINATLDEPVMTWDAVNGRFDGTTIAYSFTGVVDEEMAEAINEVNGQEYALFDLDSMQDIDHYREMVEYWLSGVGLPVGITHMRANQITVFPNPTSGKIHLSIEGKGFEDGLSIQIINQQGRIIQQKYCFPTQNDLIIDISLHPPGIYFLKATGRNNTFTTKLIKAAR